MGDVVNLRRARKARARAEEKARAAENRVRHGRTGADRRAAKAEAEKAARAADGHRLDRQGPPADAPPDER